MEVNMDKRLVSVIRWRSWAFVLVVLGWAFQVRSEPAPVPQFNVTFTGEAVGAAPSIAYPDADSIATKAQGVEVVPGGAGPNNNILVKKTYKDSRTGFVFGEGNVVVIKDGTTNQTDMLCFRGNTADQTDMGVVGIAWDMLVDSQEDRSGNVFLFAQNRSGQNIAAVMINVGTGKINILNLTDTNEAAGAIPVGTLSIGTNVHLQADLDYKSGQLSVSMNGEKLGAGPFLADSPFWGSVFYTTDPMIGAIAIDNFKTFRVR